MDVGVYGGTAGDAARGHVGVILWVNVLKALPWHTWAELWESKKKHLNMFMGRCFCFVFFKQYDQFFRSYLKSS